MSNYDPLKKSLFYTDLVEKKQHITYLFLEVLESLGDDLESLTAGEAIHEAAMRSKLPGYNPGDVESDCLVRIATRLQEVREAASNKAFSAPSSHSKPGGPRTYGSDFLAKYDKLTNAERCLYTADFDYEYAKRLYCEFDVDVTEYILSAKIEWDFNTHYLGFEGVVYGMGGSFKGSSASSVDLNSIEGQDKQDEAAVNFMARFAKRRH